MRHVDATHVPGEKSGMHALFNTSRILVCDDSPTFTAMLGAILREEGCAEVIGVNDPREVMPLLTGRGFDLLLLDMMMPHLDGVAVTRLVRQQFADAELPILVLTGSQDTALRNQALAEGANDYLHKPIDPVEVVLRARNLLLIRKSHKDQLAYSERLEDEVAARTARLDMLIDNGVQLSSERLHSRLLQAILAGGCRIGHCEAATLLLVTEDKHLRFAMRTLNDPLPISDIPLYDAATGKPILHFVSTWVAHNNASVHIPDVYQDTRFDLSGTRAFDAQTRRRTVSMLAVPLCPRDGEVLGVLQFMNARAPDTDAIVPFSPQIAKFLEALAMQAATALDIHNLLQSRDRLIDGIIRVLASTIDARSPHTGYHCQRMPGLAGMLAEAASACQEGVLAGFRFQNEDEWHEFRVAAWLHNCGKLTTPDHIVDKSTKLDLFHNRLHEIRMRFEVLLRDAMIERLECIAAGQPVTAADTRFAARKAELIDDFRFVAECNLGQEAMSTEHRDRLERIGGTVWMRHFDDRIGLSMAESRRRGPPRKTARPCPPRNGCSPTSPGMSFPARKVNGPVSTASSGSRCRSTNTITASCTTWASRAAH